MPTFAVKLLPEMPINAQVVFYQLIIDDKCPSDDFFRKIENEGSYAQEYKKLRTILDFLAQGVRLPTSQYKELKHKPKGDTIRDFEIRAKRLRLYLFEHPVSGRVIVLGSYKSSSKEESKNITQMRAYKQQFVDSLNL